MQLETLAGRLGPAFARIRRRHPDAFSTDVLDLRRRFAQETPASPGPRALFIANQDE